MLEAVDGGGGASSAAAAAQATAQSDTDSKAKQTAFNGSVDSAKNTGQTGANSAATQNNGNGGDDGLKAAQAASAATGAQPPIPNPQDDSDKKDPSALDPSFQAQTEDSVRQLKSDLNALERARKAGRSGKPELATLNKDAGKLYEDAADELRQYGGQAADPKAVIQQRAQAIRDRIPADGQLGDNERKLIDQAEKTVLDETPDQRGLQVKRTRVLRAQETVHALETANKPNANELAKARAELQAASTDLQNTVIHDTAEAIATQHLDAVNRDLASTTSEERAQVVREQVKIAEGQLQSVQQGNLPLIFSDEEKAAAMNALKERYAGVGLDQYFDAVGDALATNRDAAAAQARAPMDLSVGVAQLHLDNAKAAARSKPGPETSAAVSEAEEQLANTQNGQVPLHFTDAELQQQVAALKKQNAKFGLDADYDDIAKQLTQIRDDAPKNQAALDAARTKMTSELQAITSGQGPVAGVPEDLQRSDPVTAAFIRTLGVTVDPKDPNLSPQEQALAKAAPVAFALLQKAGIRITTNDVNANIVTVNGQPAQLTPEQQKMLQENNVFGLAGSLLNSITPDRDTHAAMIAAAETRQSYTESRVAGLVAAGKDGEALSVLDINMKATFSPDEAANLWAKSGEPRFNQAYFDRKTDEFRGKYGNDFEIAARAGGWLEENFKRLPEPAAGYLINSIENKLDPEKLGHIGSGVFYNGFSGLVEQAPSRAADVAAWYTRVPGDANGFRRPMFGFGFDYAIKEGHGAALSKAIVERAEGLTKSNPYMESNAKGLRMEFDDAMKGASTDQYKQAVKDIFKDFEPNKDVVLQNFFDHLGKGAKVTDWMAAQNTPAFRNMVGRSLGLTPTNAEAAQKLDDSQDWFDSGQQKTAVELTAKVLLQEAGPNGRVRAIPMFLAGKTVGAQGYTVFEVENGDTHKTEIIDGTAVSNMTAANPDLVKPDGSIVDKIDGKLYGDWKYENFQNFQDDNSLPDDAKLYVPKDFALQDANADGHIDYMEKAAGITTGWERFKMVGDVVVAIGATAAGIVLAVPSGGTSLALTAAAWGVTGAAIGWGGLRTLEQYHQMQEHGQSTDWGNPNARMLYFSAGVQTLGVASLGMGAAANAATRASSSFASYANAIETGARWTGRGAILGGGGLTAVQTVNIVQNFDGMSTEQRVYETLTAGLGILNTGIGVYGERQAKILGQLQSDARTAVDLHMSGQSVSKEFGLLSMDPNGAINFTSGRNARTIRVADEKGVYLRDLPAETNEALSNLAGRRSADAPEATGEPQGGPVEVKQPDEGGQPAAKTAVPDETEEAGVPQVKIDTHDHAGGEDHTHSGALNLDAVEAELHRNHAILEQEAAAISHASIREKALKESASPDEYAKHFGIKGPIEPSKWIGQAVESLRLVGRLAELQADVHSHSRPYDRRTGDRPKALIEKVGALGRILIGDIPQCCGFSHYSELNAGPLTIEGAQRLDTANVQSFRQMIDNYHGWMSLMERVGNTDAQLAIDLDRAVMAASRDENGQLVGDHANKVGDLIARVRQTDADLASSLSKAVAKNPHLALRGDLSLTGFNPGAEGAVDYVRQQLLEHPGMHKFLGEITIQKEMVSVLLGGEATFLKPEFGEFTTALDSYFGSNARDPQALMQALETFRQTQPASENFTPQLGRLRDAIENGNGRKTDEAARGLRSDLDAWEEARVRSIDNFRQILQLAQENGLGITIHCDWGEAGIGGDGRPRAEASDYRYFDQLIDLVAKYSESPDGKSQGANIVLAHAGIGRFVRPDEKPVSYRLADGTTARIPRHIMMMEEVLRRAPHVKFDISWNDVGEAFVKSPEMLQGVSDFVGRHPNSIYFGSDTLKAVNQSQYRQASTTLMPLFLKLATENPPVLWKLIRDNYESIMENIGERLPAWTEQQLRGTPDGKAKIARMREDLAALDGGQTTMRELAKREFDQITNEIAALQAEPLTLPDVPAWRLGDDTAPVSDIFDSKRLGTAPELDHLGLMTGVPARFTSHGDPAAQAVVDAAWAQTAKEFGVAGASALAGAALASTPANPATAIPSIYRQFAFNKRIQYAEFVRLSWEAIFENGSASDANIRVFLDRTMKVGKAVGIDDGDLANVVGMTKQFQKDYELVSQIELNPEAGWTEQRRQEAILCLVGLYQINLDRAVGLQTSALNFLDSRTTAGRHLNDQIMTSAGMSLGASSVNLANAAQHGTSAPALLTGAANVFDIAAFAPMIGEAMVRNFGGRNNVPLLRNHPVFKWLNTASLGSLAAGGGARFLADIASIASGNPFTPALTILDGAVAALGVKSTANESRRVGNNGVPEPGRVAKVNTALVTSIALASLTRLVQGAYGWMDDKKGDRKIDVAGAPIPGSLNSPLGATPSAGAPTLQPEDRRTPPAQPAPKADQGRSPVEVLPPEGLNIRARPSIDGARLGTFEPGATLQATGRRETDGAGRQWAEVTGRTPSGDIVTGWVAADLVKPKPAHPHVVVAAPIGLNVRSGPSLQNPKLGTFPQGAVLTPTGREETDRSGLRWIEVMGTAAGMDVKGWVAQPYIRETAFDDHAGDADGGAHYAGIGLPYSKPMATAEFLMRADHPIPA